MNLLISKEVNTFRKDVLQGLQSTSKHLESKYFYDATGDQLFRDIMNCPEYYLTNCELEILKTQTAQLAAAIKSSAEPFDLIELGAGDASKSIYLLRYLLAQNHAFTYMPIDISGNVIAQLSNKLPALLPGLLINGLHGEYFEMLKKATTLSSRRKVVLFLGSNIGNMPLTEATIFCKALRSHLSIHDRLLIGADLKKDPKTILAAYNDKAGITKQFNLNLLKRINRELQADFDCNQFDHYACYDPENGACKSYLVSLQNQQITIDGAAPISFHKDECIAMEISQKFTVKQLDQLALDTGFYPVNHFFDDKEWFMDSIWEAR
ncbi:L-histidine N(alpha)-methyltransferase [Olivibacter ginsenosidimutans]